MLADYRLQSKLGRIEHSTPKQLNKTSLILMRLRRPEGFKSLYNHVSSDQTITWMKRITPLELQRNFLDQG